MAARGVVEFSCELNGVILRPQEAGATLATVLVSLAQTQVLWAGRLDNWI